MSWLMGSIRNKLLLITGTGTTSVLLAALFMIVTAGGSLNRFASYFEVEVSTERTTRDLGIDFRRQIQQWQHLLIRGKEPARLNTHWEEFTRLEQRIQKRGTELKARLPDQASAGKLQAFLDAHLKMGAAFRSGLNTYRENGFDPVAADAAVAGMDELPSRLLAETTELIVGASSQAANSNIEKTRDGIALGLIFMGLGVVIAFVSFTWFVQAQLVSPARHLVLDMANLASGDFSQPIQAKSRDELGMIAESAESVRDSLGRIIADVQTSTHTLNESVTELGLVINTTREGVLEQKSQTELVATAVTEMTATVQEVANNAELAADAAANADREAQNGGQVVSRTIANIQKLSREISSTMEAVNKLENETGAIGTVLDVIQGISEQTNLLALNAAIEAARAGEAGRGFAVVADEVRALASRTQESTQEIQRMIERLQAGSKEVTAAMERGQHNATESTSQASEAGVALDQITAAVMRINEMNSQIAIASDQQREVAEEINKNIVTIAHVAETSADGARQTEDANVRLASLAANLNVQVERFKT